MICLKSQCCYVDNIIMLIKVTQIQAYFVDIDKKSTDSSQILIRMILEANVLIFQLEAFG